MMSAIESKQLTGFVAAGKIYALGVKKKGSLWADTVEKPP
jgi:hypothetical protein